MTEILSTVKRHSESAIHTTKVMLLKDCDFHQSIDEIDKNIHNALSGINVSKEHYQFLVCGGTAGIGNLFFILS